MLCQLNQEILKASKNNRNSSKAFQLVCSQLARIRRRFSTGCFIYNFVIQVISEKSLCSKDFSSNLRDNSYRFCYKFAFILFLSFLTNQKQESCFQQVGGLVMRKFSVFCLQRVALQFKAMPNSIDFHKGIFLHVIPVRIIVP